MKRSFVPVLVYLLLAQAFPSAAQYYYYNDKYYNSDFILEVGGTVGVMNSLTDLGGKKGIGKRFIKDLNWKLTKPSFGIYATAMYKDVLGIRLEATVGKVGSYDSILKSVAASTMGRYERNLSFQSNVTDVQVGVEVHPLFFKHYDENEAPRASPYAIAGLGFFSFNPQAKLNGQWHFLQPLRTEGQGFAEYPDRKRYKLTQVNIPVGIGAKYEVNSFVNARLELVYRFLFTDYLDDASNKDYIDPSLFANYLSAGQATLAQQLYDRRISAKNDQRGDPADNDAYFTIQLKVGVTLRSTSVKR